MFEFRRVVVDEENAVLGGKEVAGETAPDASRCTGDEEVFGHG